MQVPPRVGRAQLDEVAPEFGARLRDVLLVVTDAHDLRGMDALAERKHRDLGARRRAPVDEVEKQFPAALEVAVAVHLAADVDCEDDVDGALPGEGGRRDAEDGQEKLAELSHGDPGPYRPDARKPLRRPPARPGTRRFPGSPPVRAAAARRR